MKRLFIAVMAAFAACFALSAQDLDAEYAKDLLKAGADAPSFTINDIEGKPHSLKDFRGSYVVLDFWATWCPDCRKDLPKMKELYAKYASDNVVFVGVSFDEKPEKLAEYVAANGIEWLQVSEFKKWKGEKNLKISDDYHVRWIPSLYLIDPKGKIVLGTVMLEKLEAALESIK